MKQIKQIKAQNGRYSSILYICLEVQCLAKETQVLELFININQELNGDIFFLLFVPSVTFLCLTTQLLF